MALWEANGAPCSLCGRTINYAFTRAVPRHRMAGTAHHIIGLEQGGDPYDPTNLAPAHMACNTREGNRIRWARVAAAAGRPLPVLTSRRW